MSSLRSYKDAPRYPHLKSKNSGQAGDIFPLMATFVKKEKKVFTINYAVFFLNFQISERCASK